MAIHIIEQPQPPPLSATGAAFDIGGDIFVCGGGLLIGGVEVTVGVG